MKYTAAYWRQRAEETRVKGEAMRHPGSREIMFDLANDFEKLARRVELISDRLGDESQS
jgi:hypothetical protein